MSITAKIVQEEKNKTGNRVSQSRSIRMYQQRIALPQNADESTIKTAYKNKKLVVSIAKKKVVQVASTPTKEEKNKSKESNITGR
jgi:HSP20 family molecular chaperone IbpA